MSANGEEEEVNFQQRSEETGGVGLSCGMLRKLQEWGGGGRETKQLVWLMTLLISGAVLILLTTLTLVTTFVGFIIAIPFLIFTIPIWLPLVILTLLFVSIFGFTLVVAGGLAWLYKYVMGQRPPGADRVDHARTRIAHTATNVKDYAKGYGLFFHERLKHAAPGA